MNIPLATLLNGGTVTKKETDVPPQVYSILKSTSRIVEGSSVDFAVIASGVPDGTVLYWETDKTTTTAADYLHDSGTVTVSKNKAAFSVQIAVDSLVETGESFRVLIKDANGILVAMSGGVDIIDKPINQRPDLPWQVLDIYRVYVAPPTVTHGNAITIIAITPSTANDSLLFYTIKDITTNGLEHFKNVSGEIAIANHIGLVLGGTVPYSIGNTDKLYQVQLRRDSISGLVLATSEPYVIHNPLNTRIFYPPTISTPKSCIEGETITIMVYIGSATATTAMWQVNTGTTQGLADLSALSGSFAITNKVGSFTIDILKNIPIESTYEYFSVDISINGQFLIASDSIYIIPPTFAITNTTPITEGATVVFAVETTAFIGSSLYWSIQHDTTNNADLSPLSGIVSLTDGKGTLTLDIANDFKSEGTETFRINLHRTNGGAVIAFGDFSILDTSSSNVTMNRLSVDEGGSIGFTVNVTGAPPAMIYYTVLDITTSGIADLDSISGSIPMTGNSGYLLLSAIEDHLTEGIETFKVQFRKDSIAGDIFYTTDTITINDTSLTPVYNLSVSPTSAKEGVAMVASVTTQNVASGTTLYYKVNNIGTVNTDLSSVSGSFTITGNTGTFTITPVVDAVKENPESFTVDIMTGSTSGTVVANSGYLTIAELSSYAETISSISGNLSSITLIQSVTENINNISGDLVSISLT